MSYYIWETATPTPLKIKWISTQLKVFLLSNLVFISAKILRSRNTLNILSKIKFYLTSIYKRKCQMRTWNSSGEELHKNKRESIKCPFETKHSNFIFVMSFRFDVFFDHSLLCKPVSCEKFSQLKFCSFARVQTLLSILNDPRELLFLLLISFSLLCQFSPVFSKGHRQQNDWEELNLLFRVLCFIILFWTYHKRTLAWRAFPQINRESFTC